MEGMQKVVDAAHDRIEINDLPDDVVIEILSRLSRMNRREAVRTSILSRKWRYLPSFCPSSVPVTLVLDDRDLSTRTCYNSREQFVEWVGRVLKLHRDVSLEGLIVRASCLETRRRWDKDKPGDVETLVYRAVRRRVKVFELECDSEHEYEFPDLRTMPERFFGYFGGNTFDFVSLTFVGVNIADGVIHSIIHRCHHLEKLCIRRCSCITHLRVSSKNYNYVPTCLKVLEISYAQTLEISVPTLVSCTYGGDRLLFPFKGCPNLSELTLGGTMAWSFVHQPMEHASYSDQLVKLGLNFLTMSISSPVKRPDLPRLCLLKHLELNLVLPVGKSIHFFIKFISGSPLLKELRIKITYIVKNPRSKEILGFPEDSPSSNLDRAGHHKNLKVVKMSGYVGCAIDDKFILRLLKIAQSLKTVAIDTESEYYDQKPWDCATQCPNDRKRPCGFCSLIDFGARTRAEATRRANQLKLSFPLKTKAALTVT